MRRSVRSLWLFVSLFAACADRPPQVEPTAAAPAAAPPATSARSARERAPAELSLGDGYEMRRPLQDGRLTVIPIVDSRAPRANVPRYLALHDGMKRDLVSVRELPPMTVDTVRIHNKSPEPVFAMAGELIVGGHQDRVIARDVIVPAHATADVEVRCVEQNRDGGRRAFNSGNAALAQIDLRDAVVHKTQSDVWTLVDAINTQHHVAPKTKTYRLVAQVQDARRAGALAERLAELPDRERLVGLAVAIDGRVVAMDRFASPELYDQLEGELLRSYVASDTLPPRDHRSLLPDDVRAFAATSRLSTTTDASFVAVTWL
jgi:hypothetical protein